MTFQDELAHHGVIQRKIGGCREHRLQRMQLGRIAQCPCGPWRDFCLFASMFDAPLHPKLVHVPLGLAVVLPLVLLVLLVAIRKDLLPARSWWLGAFLAAIVAGGAGLAVRSGDAEAERVEAVVAESFVDEHEESGEQMLVSAIVTAVLSAAGGLVRRRNALLAAHAAAVMGAIVTLALGIRAGGLGGALVYKHGAAGVYAPGPATAGPVKGAPTPKNHDDED